MRIHEIMQEAAAKDVLDDIDVSKAAILFVNHVYSSNTIRFTQGGLNCPYVYLGDLGVPDRLVGVYVMMVKNYEHAGSMEPPQNAGSGYKIYLPVTGYEKHDLVRSTNNTKMIEVLKHELHHVLDYKRLHNRNTKKNDYDPGEEMTPEWRSTYYNTPTEYNSYFFGLASPWLNRIRDMRDDPEMLELYDPLSRDFVTAMRDLVKKASRGDRAAYEHLNPEMKRHFIKRLYALFQQYWGEHDGIEGAADQTAP